MSKKKIRRPVQNTIQVKKTKSELKTSCYIILLGYILLPVFTHGFNTLDSNGPKFLAIALLNLISFNLLLADPDSKKHPEIRSGFFRSFIGIAYTLFLAISLLSFFNAINIGESILALVKIFTVFSATYILFIIFRSNRKYLLFVAIAINIVLLVDCLTVFYNMLHLITGKVSTVYDIKSVYSHKNILASALFVKLPVSIWLMFYSIGWKKIFGYIVGLSAILATFLLSTRAFYLGLIFLLIALIAFAIVRFFVAEKKSQLMTIAKWTGLCIIALVVFVIAQQLLFPKKDSIIGNTGIVSRLSSISYDESSTNARISSWKRTLKLISEHPVLGVGTGNWKVQVLKYENPTIGDHIFMYKNHNDFLEMTAETGIPGGLAYLSIFIMILYGFIKVCLKAGNDEDRLKLLFFSAFGIVAYSVDAFFNFPADRAEIQTLFAIYTASAIAFTEIKHVSLTADGNNKPFLVQLKKRIPAKLKVTFSLLLLIGSVWILAMFVQSLHYQFLAKQDLDKGNARYSSDIIIKGFPSIPNLNAYSNPISVTKARYLIRDKRDKEAIQLLLPDHSSPFETEREYFLATAYLNLGMNDSALFFCYKVLEMKPLFYEVVDMICHTLSAKGDIKTPAKLLQDYMKLKKTNPRAWLYLSDLYDQSGNLGKSFEAIDSAYKYSPYDTLILQKKKYLQYQVWINKYKDVMVGANASFLKKDYRKAVIEYSKIIKQEPGYMPPYELRGLSYFNLKEYKSAINDYSCLIRNKIFLWKYYNARGECFHYLKNDEAACHDFKAAMDKGNKQAASNYRTFCVAKDKK